MPDKKRLVGSAGGSVTTIAIGLYASGWPEHIRAHPLIVVAVALVGICLVAYAFLFAPTAKAEPSQSIGAGGDNSGSQFHAGRDIHVYDTPKAIYPPERPPAPASLPQPKAPLPVLRLDFSSADVDVLDDAVVFAPSGGEKCHSIRVHNKEAAEGEEAHRADAISARLTFKASGSSRITSVDRACWIGDVENEIYLEPGDTKHVLFGIPNKKNEWITYDNPNKYAPQWPSTYYYLQEVKFPLFPSSKIVGEISVISHRNNKSTTLATRTFVVTIDDSNVFINVRWRDEI